MSQAIKTEFNRWTIGDTEGDRFQRLKGQIIERRVDSLIMSEPMGHDQGTKRTPIILWALFGGFVGALVMGGVAMIMPVPMTGGAPFFVAAAMKMGLMGTMAWAVGWMFHLMTGRVVGVIFGLVVVSVRPLRLSSPVRAISWGVGVGLVVWLVFFLPMRRR